MRINHILRGLGAASFLAIGACSNSLDIANPNVQLVAHEIGGAGKRLHDFHQLPRPAGTIAFTLAGGPP